jgi:O-Antigen ligase
MVKTLRRHTLLLAGWSLNLILTPFYIFASGNPQPADVLMALLIAYVACGLFIRLPRMPDLYICVAVFLLIAVNVNLFWWTIYTDEFFIKSSLFYVFNAGVMISIVALYASSEPERVSRFTAWGILIAVLIEVVLVIVFAGHEGIRSIGTFNNPNQLGYWCLASGACWLVVRGESRLDWLDAVVLGGAGYLTTVSLSKAAIGGFALLVVFAVVAHGVRSRWSAAAVGVVLLALPMLIIEPTLLKNHVKDFFSHGTAALVVERVESVGKQQDDSLAGRGYDRLWRHSSHLFFGAGEGAYERFDPGPAAMELHSTWGTVLFSYGITGLLAFLALLWASFRHAPRRYLFYFIPIALYGLTHQGLRFSLFWVFLGLVIGVSRYRSSARVPTTVPAKSPSDTANADPLPHGQRPEVGYGARFGRVGGEVL